MLHMSFLSLVLVDALVRMEAVAVGTVVAVVLTLFHVSLLGQIVRRYRRNSRKALAYRFPVVALFCYFGGTVLLMLLLHFLDTGLWATFLDATGLVPEIHQAFYFAANTYTTLGYGDVPLSNDWRELAPVMAISGLFTFGCTTGQLFDVMSSHNKAIESCRAKDGM